MSVNETWGTSLEELKIAYPCDRYLLRNAVKSSPEPDDTSVTDDCRIMASVLIQLFVGLALIDGGITNRAKMTPTTGMIVKVTIVDSSP
ncbi:MAG: hypothetical protein JSW11_15935 [Candidatus Heimdallarchaeota archaeon]|nr:MAG: hypothetical protein JSW11_15935 [Candidatus Heimdallarchaeota archaeon]